MGTTADSTSADAGLDAKGWVVRDGISPLAYLGTVKEVCAICGHRLTLMVLRGPSGARGWNKAAVKCTDEVSPPAR